MADRHTSMRGDVIDMNRMRNANAETIALGNARMNARGDRLGQKGVVLKTQEQIEAEWAANRAAMEASVRSADIKADTMIPKNPEPVTEKKLDVDDQDFAPIEAQAPVASKPAPRRKITETDN